VPRTQHDRERERKKDQEDHERDRDPEATPALGGRDPRRDGSRRDDLGAAPLAVPGEHLVILDPERTRIRSQEPANEDLAG